MKKELSFFFPKKRKKKGKRNRKNPLSLSYLPAVQADALDAPPRSQQHGTPRRLVHAPRLHPHEAGLHDVDAADPVVAGDFVELRQQRRGGESRSIQRNGVAVLESDLDVGGLVRGRLRRHRAGEHGLGGLDPGVLEGVSCFLFFVFFLCFFLNVFF